MLRRRGNQSPTPSDFIDEHAYTPSHSLPTSPETFRHARDSEATMLNQLDMRVHDNPDEVMNESEEENLIMHVMKPVSSMQPDEAPATSASPAPTADDNSLTIDLDELLASGDLDAIRLHFVKLNASLANAASKAQSLELQLAEAQCSLPKIQPMICGKDGLPLVLSSAKLLAPAPEAQTEKKVEEEKEPIKEVVATPQKQHTLQTPSIGIQLVSPTRHFLVSPAKPFTSQSSYASTAAALAAAASAKAASRSLIKKHAFDPIVRTNKLTKGLTRDIRESLNHFGNDMKETCKLIVGALMNHDSTSSDLYTRYQVEKKQRKLLHNQLIDLQGNIRVFARIRPLMSNTAQNASGGENGVAVAAASNSHLLANPNDAGRIVQEIEQDATRFVDEHTLGHSGKVFEFDQVLHQQSTQEQVYKNVAPFIQSVIDGFQCCILAYGQTGSGKTHTMDGTESNPGVNQRALLDLFHLLKNRNGDEYEYSVKLGSIEIYNEQLRDLLVEPSIYKKNLALKEAQGGFGSKAEKDSGLGGSILNSVSTSSSSSSSANASAIEVPKLEIHQNTDGSIYIPNLIERQVESVADIVSIMNQYVKPNRTTAATSMNEYSSRSHSLIFITVESYNKENEERTTGRLVLVDLAGSERVGKSEAAGQRLKEASAINQSLSALGDVIAALKNKAAHIPYRNSRLTHVLKDCLGGSSKVLMFAQISPSVSDSQESLCTLNFASRVRSVQLGQAKKKQSTKNGSASLTKLLKAETLLVEKDTIHEKTLKELREVREELSREKIDMMARLRESQENAAERIRTLEQELSKKSVPAPVTVVDSNEINHLNAIIRAKDREILELKLQRNQFNPSASPMSSTTPASIVARISTPKIHGMGGKPMSSPFGHKTFPTLASSNPTLMASITPTVPGGPLQAQGVNLLEVDEMNSSASSIPFSIDDADFKSTDLAESLVLEDLDVSAIPKEAESISSPMAMSAPVDKENAEVAVKGRDSLTGQKRKSGSENEDENSSAQQSKPAVVNKKAKVAPVTPAKAVLGVISGAVNNASNVVVAMDKSKAVKVPVKDGTTGMFTRTKALQGHTPKKLSNSKVAQAWQPPKVELASAAAAASSSALDESMDDLNSTPIPSNTAAKSVRFGETSTKFISPTPIHSISHSISTAMQAPVNENLRVKSARVASARVNSASMTGGAKRQVVKNSNQPTWNSSFK